MSSATRQSRGASTKKITGLKVFGLIGIAVLSICVIGYFLVAYTSGSTESVYYRNDESVLTDGTGVYTPYRQIGGLANVQGITLLWNGEIGTAAREITADESLIADRLGISVAEMYCSNGTAKIFYGTVLYVLPVEYAILFKLAGSWHIYAGISQEDIGKWISAVVSESWEVTVDPAAWWLEVFASDNSYSAVLLSVAFAKVTFPSYMLTQNGAPFLRGDSYVTCYLITEANAEAKVGTLHESVYQITVRLHTYYVSLDGRAAFLWDGNIGMYIYVR